MEFCSPNINIKKHYTCFTHDELINITKALNDYNVKYKNNKRKENIDSKIIDLNKNYSTKKLWYKIYNRLKNICQYEYCWIDLKFIDSIPDKDLRNKIKYFTFKPKMTIEQYSWLSTNDINYVLKQYEKVDKNFKFLGALPSDFYKIISKNMLNEMYNDIYNYIRIGLIFNLDTHNLNGSHWTALYIDNDLKTIEYFDSVGNRPNKYINKIVKKIQLNLMKKFKKNYKILINDVEHQTQNSECGIYSIYYIIHRLFGNSFIELSTNIIKDEDMNKFRYNIFRPRN
jgi:hypothetical protein